MFNDVVNLTCINPLIDNTTINHKMIRLQTHIKHNYNREQKFV